MQGWGGEGEGCVCYVVPYPVEIKETPAKKIVDRHGNVE